MTSILREVVTPNVGKYSTFVEESDDAIGGKVKHLYLKGIAIQGNLRNANGRVYPTHEIANAVKTINKQLADGYTVCGECDHPADLKINADRVSHIITEMWMEGNDGHAKMKIIPTPMGNIVKALIESGVKIGVSSRGSGEVHETTGQVSDFEIVTVDAVISPSAPNAYPKPIYEGLLNMRGGNRIIENARGDLSKDARVQKYLQEQITKVIKELRIK